MCYKQYTPLVFSSTRRHKLSRGGANEVIGRCTTLRYGGRVKRRARAHFGVHYDHSTNSNVFQFRCGRDVDDGSAVSFQQEHIQKFQAIRFCGVHAVRARSMSTKRATDRVRPPITCSEEPFIQPAIYMHTTHETLLPDRHVPSLCTGSLW